MSKPFFADNRYHAHLDVCKQCREHPFALCRQGAELLKEVALKSEEILRKDIDAL